MRDPYNLFITSCPNTPPTELTDTSPPTKPVPTPDDPEMEELKSMVARARDSFAKWEGRLRDLQEEADTSGDNTHDGSDGNRDDGYTSGQETPNSVSSVEMVPTKSVSPSPETRTLEEQTTGQTAASSDKQGPTIVEATATSN